MISVVVTGGSGFLGKGLIVKLLQGHTSRICVYSRDEAKHAAIRAAFNNDPQRRQSAGGRARDGLGSQAMSEQTNEYSRTRVFVEALDRVRARVFPG